MVGEQCKVFRHALRGRRNQEDGDLDVADNEHEPGSINADTITFWPTPLSGVEWMRMYSDCYPWLPLYSRAMRYETLNSLIRRCSSPSVK